MTPRRFAWLLAARGPDISAWSPADHAAAVSLLRSDSTAQAALADALAAEDAPAPDRDGLRRMRGRVRNALTPPPPLLRGLRAGTLAACAAAGLYLGLVSGDADVPASPGFAASLDASATVTVLAALDP